MISGVYIISAPSGSRYVGSAINIRDRWAQHLRALKRRTHQNKPLQRAWNKYDGALTFAKLLICRKQDLLMYEQRAIDVLEPEYNIHRVAGSALGFRHSDKTRAQISARRKGMVFSDEHRANIGAASKGRITSAETRAKQSNTLKVTLATPESRARISATSTGKHHSEASKRKMSENAKGRVIPPEQRAKISAALKGRPLSEEHYNNMVAVQRSPAHRAKLSAAHLKRGESA